MHLHHATLKGSLDSGALIYCFCTSLPRDNLDGPYVFISGFSVRIHTGVKQAHKTETDKSVRVEKVPCPLRSNTSAGAHKARQCCVKFACASSQ